MNIAVYCGANSGNHTAYMDAARELGEWIAANDHALVYGAGAEGMMGAVSKAVLDHDGTAIGVIPQFMVDAGWNRKDLTKMYVTENMSQRKAQMIRLADAYIALPGGIGTLEEIIEVISLDRLGQQHKPCILYNVEGYYEPLRAAIDQMVKCDFLSMEDRNAIHFAGNLSEVVAMMEA